MQYIEAKSILSKLRGADPWFGITYNKNLYRGCQHGCIYCDSRSECYRRGELSQVSVKANTTELLSRELRAKRHAKATIGSGASYILPMFGIMLRKGSREYFYRALDSSFPALSNRYRSTFGDRYMCYSPDYARLSDLFGELCAQYGLDTKMRFYTPPSYQQGILF